MRAEEVSSRLSRKLVSILEYSGWFNCRVSVDRQRAGGRSHNRMLVPFVLATLSLNARRDQLAQFCLSTYILCTLGTTGPIRKHEASPENHLISLVWKFVSSPGLLWGGIVLHQKWDLLWDVRRKSVLTSNQVSQAHSWCLQKRIFQNKQWHKEIYISQI